MQREAWSFQGRAGEWVKPRALQTSDRRIHNRPAAMHPNQDGWNPRSSHHRFGGQARATMSCLPLVRSTPWRTAQVGVGHDLSRPCCWCSDAIH